jgi:hypothetical protein
LRVSSDSSANTIASTLRELRAAPAAFELGELELSITGDAGDASGSSLSPHALHLETGLVGVSVLDGPTYTRIAGLGTIPPSGTLTASLELPPISGPLTSTTWHAQPRFRQTNGLWVLANASDFHVLDCEISRDCNANGTPDACEMSAGSIPDCNGNSFPDTCEVDCNGNGVPDDCDIVDGTSQDANGDGIPDECGPETLRIYVDASQTGPADGRCWGTAFADLQLALDLADESSSPRKEIWLAEGAYRPAPPGGSTAKMFSIPEGTSLYGGFAGTEVDLGERDPHAHPTALSGDLNGDDGPNFSNYADNSRLVARFSADDVKLDGLIIRAGNGDSNSGGGLDISNRSTEIRGCTFVENRGPRGAGLLLGLNGSESILVHACTFLHNEATHEGGGLYCWPQGGQNLVISGCVFIGNVANEAGGGAWVSDRCVMICSLFAGNEADFGGGVRASGITTLQGCTLALNRARDASGGGGIEYIGLLAAKLAIHDSVLWGNTANGAGGEAAQIQYESFLQSPVVTYSCIEGLTSFAGNHNIGSDPLFVDPNGADGIPGTLDDDYRLGPGSPCVDSGRNNAMPIDSFDLDADDDAFELWPLDLDGAARFQDDPNVQDTELDRGTSSIADATSARGLDS